MMLQRASKSVYSEICSVVESHVTRRPPGTQVDLDNEVEVDADAVALDLDNLVDEPDQTDGEAEANNAPLNDQDAPIESQVIPSPATLERISAVQKSSVKVSQEPTPPTSDAAMSPTPRAKAKFAQHASTHNSPLTAPDSSPPHRTPLPSTIKRRESREWDMFESLAPFAQSSIPRPMQGKQPMIRVEGAFNSALARPKGASKVYNKSRRVSGVEDADEDEEPKQADVWPPKRGKGKEKATQIIPPAVETRQTVLASPAAKTNNRASNKSPDVVKPSSSRILPDNLVGPAHISSDDGTSRRLRAHAVAGPSHLPQDNTVHGRRHTLATPAQRAVLPRGRAHPRHSLPALLPVRDRRESIGSVASSSSSASFAGRMLSEDDHMASTHIGMHSLLQRLAESRGFSYDVVENTFKGCGTIALTDEILKRMVRGATDAAEAGYDELGIQSLEEDPQPAIEYSVSANRSRRTVSYNDEEYYPPDDSKAAIFLRQQQGRQARDAEAPDSIQADSLSSSDEDDDDNDDLEESDGRGASQDSFAAQATRLLARFRRR